jgi:hypothetical protein
MGLSGILLNHPSLISDLSVPGWLVPSQYRVQDWNRSRLINLVYSQRNPNIAYAAGKEGVWKTADGGSSFQPMTDGFPSSRFYRKTNHVLLWEEDSSLLFAGTDCGLFVCDLQDESWQRVSLGEETERVLKILMVRGQLVAFTSSHAYVCSQPAAELQFRRLPLLREEDSQQVSLVRLFFDLHGGSAWGLPGRLLFDFTGLVLVFLSVSGFYIWYFPVKRRTRGKAPTPSPEKSNRLLLWLFFKYHLKIGIWIAVILSIIGVTGLFMRPPMLALLADGFISRTWYPGLLPPNPWDEKIHNALCDTVEDRIIIEATDGFWSGPADFNGSFVHQDLPVPVFVMGTTVFRPYGTAGFLVGSFNGIFHLERASGKVVDLLAGGEPVNVSSVRTTEFMVTGYFKTPQGEEFITTHEQGLMPLGNAKLNGRLTMPSEIIENYRMPMWNYLFELHNGRIFKDVFGELYILIIPLGAVFLTLVTLSGTYDWVYLRLRRK